MNVTWKTWLFSFHSFIHSPRTQAWTNVEPMKDAAKRKPTRLKDVLSIDDGQRDRLELPQRTRIIPIVDLSQKDAMHHE